MLLRLACLLMLLWPLPATAQELAGNWTFGIGQVGIFQFRLEREGESWRGIWLRPKSFASNGVVFENVTGPTVDVPASQIREVGEWMELTFDDPRPGAVPDVFLLRGLADGTAEAVYSGTGFAPFELRRDVADSGIGPWDSTITYRRAGLEQDTVRPTIQFSDGRSALASRIARLILEQQAQQAEIEAEAADPDQESAPLGPSESPAMLGR